MSAATAAARRPATVAGREHFGQGLRAAGATSPSMTRSVCTTDDQQAHLVTYRSAARRCLQPFALRAAICPGAGVVHADASADDPDVVCLGPLLALRDVELDLLPFLQAAVAATRDRADVHEHVRAALDRDETVALVAVEPLHSALRHLDLLGCGCGTRYGRGSALAPIAFGQPVTERAGGVDRATGRLPGGWNFPARPASAAGANTRAGGACPAEAPRS